MHVDMRMATTASREWETPYELAWGIKPCVAHLRPFCSKTAVTIPKDHRSRTDDPSLRAQSGRFVGFRGVYNKCPAILLSGNRLVHSRHTTYHNLGNIRFHPEEIADPSPQHAQVPLIIVEEVHRPSSKFCPAFGASLDLGL